METKKIKNRVIETSQVKWKELEFIQDSNFKEWINDGDKKLIESLLKYQFVDPFKVWENEGKIYCLDGKHRYLDLLYIESLGIEIPEELPATFMECESKESAAELVLIYSSQYAKITQQGLFDFSEKFSLELPELNSFLSIPYLEFDKNDIPFPDEFIAPKSNKPPSIKLIFETDKQLMLFEKKLKDIILIEEFNGIVYSISQGEL